MANPDGNGKLVTPYIPFKTFLGFIARLNSTVVPPRIDSSVLTSMAGSVRGQLLSTLKFLGLVDGEAVVNDKLKALVKAYGTPEWKDTLSDILAGAYSEVIGELDLDAGTASQLYDRFRDYGVAGQMIDKSVRFYLAALTESGGAFSPHFRVRGASQAANPMRRRAQRPIKQIGAAVGDDAQMSDQLSVSVSTVARFQFPVPGKGVALITIPKDLNEDDWEMIDAMFRAYVARQSKSEKKKEA